MIIRNAAELEIALKEIQMLLERMRGLAVLATSEALTSRDRACIQREIEKLRDGIDLIAETRGAARPEEAGSIFPSLPPRGIV